MEFTPLLSFSLERKDLRDDLPHLFKKVWNGGMPFIKAKGDGTVTAHETNRRHHLRHGASGRDDNRLANRIRGHRLHRPIP